jgi:membrane dipeptidase
MKRIKRGVFFLLSFVTILICLRILIGLLLREAPQILTPDEETLRTRALRLHHNATEVDTHNDVPTWILDFGFDLGMDGDEKGDRYPFLYYREGPFHWLPGRPHGENVGTHTDLARIREDGLDAEFFSIWVDRSDYENGEPGQARQRAFDMIEALQKSVRRNPNDIEFAFTALDLERIVSEGKLAALMGLEGGHAIEDDLKTLGHFYDLGVRYMTLTHNCSHGWADSSTDSPVNDGLSEFGREVVREMNRPGMIVDVSHVSDKTFWDVLEVTSAPIIASHSNCRAIADHPRNMTDGMIRAVADNNGVVVVNFMTPFLDSKRTEYWKILTGWHMFSHPQHPETPLSLLIDQIEHVVQVAGIDHVGGLGSDFDGIPFLPKGLQDVGDLPNITVELVRRGYSEDDIRKILGGNVIRVLAEVERIAVVKADSVTH